MRHEGAHEGAPGSPAAVEATPGPTPPVPAGSGKRKHSAAAAPQEGRPPLPTPPPPAHEVVRLALRGVAASQLRLLPPSRLAEISQEVCSPGPAPAPAPRRRETNPARTLTPTLTLTLTSGAALMGGTHGCLRA